MAALNRGTPG